MSGRPARGRSGTVACGCAGRRPPRPGRPAPRRPRSAAPAPARSTRRRRPRAAARPRRRSAAALGARSRAGPSPRVRRRIAADDVGLGHREVHDDGDDAGEEDQAGQGGAETEAAVGGRLRQVVPDRGAQGAGQHVDDPERQHGVQTEPPADRGGRDDHGDGDPGHEVAQPEDLRHEVAGGGAEGEGDQDREPVERLTAAGADRVDRQGALGAVPRDEGRREQHARTPPCSARAGPRGCR